MHASTQVRRDEILATRQRYGRRVSGVDDGDGSAVARNPHAATWVDIYEGVAPGNAINSSLVNAGSIDFGANRTYEAPSVWVEPA